MIPILEGVRMEQILNFCFVALGVPRIKRIPFPVLGGREKCWRIFALWLFHVCWGIQIIFSSENVQGRYLYIILAFPIWIAWMLDACFCSFNDFFFNNLSPVVILTCTIYKSFIGSFFNLTIVLNSSLPGIMCYGVLVV